MTHAPRVYLIGSVEGPPEERVRRFAPARDELVMLGYQVTAPCITHPNTASPEERDAAVLSEMRLMLSADYIVALDGADRCWETSFAIAYGVPILSLDDFVQEAAA